MKEPQPQWRRIDISKDGKLREEGRQLALYLHGPHWSEAHDQTVAHYVQKNTKSA